MRAEALSTSLDQIDDIFYTLDDDWRFTYCNLQVERVTGRLRADLIGKVIWDEFPQTAGSILEREYRRAVAERVTVEFETYYEGARSLGQRARASLPGGARRVTRAR